MTSPPYGPPTTLPTWATAPARPPDSMRSCTLTWSGSTAMAFRIESFSDSLSAVSGAILMTFAPFPLKYARKEPVCSEVAVAWHACPCNV